MFKYFSPLLPFIFGLILLVITPGFTLVAQTNVAAQLTLFALVVCWPAWKTNRLSYVDIAWPFGLVVISIITFSLLDGFWLRNLAVSFVYLFIGLRMGREALLMWRGGELDHELPRYQYQRRRWERAGKTNTSLAIQVDAIMQALGNASYLAFPAFIIGANSSAEISIFEILGLSIWLCAFSVETLADAQKKKFIRDMLASGQNNKVCNIGLWRYSRHPNYFAEWMVWTALVIAAIPSWVALYGTIHIALWCLLGVGLFMTSKIMHTTLVYFTGAVPSEYYSVKKRPDYKEYQQTTNIFFPGPRRKP